MNSKWPRWDLKVNLQVRQNKSPPLPQPQLCPHPNPRTWEYIALFGKREFADCLN